jgi:hypothetical protein
VTVEIKINLLATLEADTLAGRAALKANPRSGAILAIPLYSRDKTVPFETGSPSAGGLPIAFEQNARAWLSVRKVPTRPMHVRNNSGCRNPIAISQDSCKARSSVDRGILADSIAEFANLDSDTLAVTLTAIVSVVALFRGQQMFDDLAIIDGKMPYDPTRAPKPRVVPAALTFHYQIPGMYVGRRVDVLGRVNRNKARPHCSTNEPTMNVWG